MNSPEPLHCPAPVADDDHSAIEREIAAIWQETVGRQTDDRDADFFEEGGDSLGLLRLLAAIERRWGWQIPHGRLARRVTLAGLMNMVADEQARVDTGTLVTLQPDGDLPPFFCVHGQSGNVLHLHLLARHTGSRRPFVALRCPPGRMPAASIEDIARGYADAVLARQPRGAIALGGYSLGAVIAFEMARQIMAAGRDVAVLAVIDFPLPGRTLSARTILPALARWVGGLPAYVGDPSFRDDVTDWGRAARRRFGNAMRIGLGRPPVPPPPRFPYFTPEQVLLADSHRAALRRYRRRDCDVPVAVFRSRAAPIRWLPGDATLGWRDVARTVVAAERVPGNHYSLTTEPHVRELARALGQVLDRMQA